MIRLMCAAAVVVVVVTAAGCGGAVGCDFRQKDNPEDRCQERRNIQSVGFDAACQALSGKAVDGGCPTDGIVAGCALSGDITDWYYAPKTRDDVVSACDGDGDVIDPP